MKEEFLIVYKYFIDLYILHFGTIPFVIIFLEKMKLFPERNPILADFCKLLISFIVECHKLLYDSINVTVIIYPKSTNIFKKIREKKI